MDRIKKFLKSFFQKIAPYCVDYYEHGKLLIHFILISEVKDTKRCVLRVLGKTPNKKNFEFSS